MDISTETKTKKVGGRPKTYESRETQIYESRRKIKINRCVKDIKKKMIKLSIHANDDELNQIKENILKIIMNE